MSNQRLKNLLQYTMRLEFHCHTDYSADGLISPLRLVEVGRRKGIDRIVVTDHNTIAGARAAYQLDPQRVIVGEEILTQSGELLVAFVQEEVPPGLPALETISILREQGAFISVSHPFDTHRKGHWKTPALLEIAPLVDAIEVFNSRCIFPSFNHKARAFARQHGLLGTVGSDAHAASEVGRATHLLADFNDASSLKNALAAGKEEARLSGFWVHFYSRYAKWVKRKKKANLAR
jgi:predicted metal-dependent phosphoesterase TrpH